MAAKRCAICGSTENLHIEHLIPKSLGGDSSPENLIYICAAHNRSAWAREFDFSNYIAELMKASKIYSSVQVEAVFGRTNKFRADILASEQIGSTRHDVIVECKVQASMSLDRVMAAGNQLLRYQAELPKSRLIIAVPGRVSPNAKEWLKAQQIELWDRDTIVQKFEQQISSNPHPYFPFAPKTPAPSEHDRLIDEIGKCPKGLPGWTLYQQLIGQIVSLCFCPPLRAPIGELADYTKTNRRDFILPNISDDGFWKYIRKRYSADYIVVDAKNSGKRITKKEVLQIANYLKPQGTGMFGVIFSRMGADAGAKHTLREQWLLHSKMILVLDDAAATNILLNAGSGGTGTQPLEDAIQAFRLSM